MDKEIVVGGPSVTGVGLNGLDVKVEAQTEINVETLSVCRLMVSLGECCEFHSFIIYV